jgi:hypothetical protein
MKTTNSIQRIFVKSYLITSLLILTELMTGTVNAQNYSRQIKKFQSQSSSHIILAVEGGLGTTTTTFKSDIADLNGLKVLGEGWSSDIIIGNNNVRFRAGVGRYLFTGSSSQKVSQTMLSGKITISPAALFGHLKYFRPYLLTGADYSIYRLKGIDIPKPVELVAEAVNPCLCICEGAPPANPGMPVDQGASSDAIIDDGPVKEPNPTYTIKKPQINGGLGIEMNILKNGRFFRMFAEAYYGIPLDEAITDLSLSKTSISAQMAINLGVGIGIGR